MELIEQIECKLCSRKFRSITASHLKKEHQITLREYMDTYGDNSLYPEKQDDSRTLLLDTLRRHWG